MGARKVKNSGETEASLGGNRTTTSLHNNKRQGPEHFAEHLLAETVMMCARPTAQVLQVECSIDSYDSQSGGDSGTK